MFLFRYNNPNNNPGLWKRLLLVRVRQWEKFMSKQTGMPTKVVLLHQENFREHKSVVAMCGVAVALNCLINLLILLICLMRQVGMVITENVEKTLAFNSRWRTIDNTKTLIGFLKVYWFLQVKQKWHFKTTMKNKRNVLWAVFQL